MIRAGALILLLFAAAAAAQPRTSETIEVSIVNVDVVVTDGDGRRVTGLTADDFEIRENGRLQPVTHFTEYTSAVTGGNASIEAAPGAVAASSRPPRTIVVFLERTRLAEFQWKQVFDSIRALLRTAVRAGDRVTIVTWNGVLDVRQPFTDDLGQIESVLAAVEKEHNRGRPHDAGDESVLREQAESDAAAAEMAAAGALSTGGMPPVHALDAAGREYESIERKTEALETLMNAVSAYEGKKIFLLAMNRFGMHVGVSAFPSGTVPFDRRRALSTEKFRDALIRTANANGITLYPIYPTGLRSSGVAAQAHGIDLDADLAHGARENNILLNEAGALADLAEATGGLMAWGPGNIAGMLPRVAEDLETYYSLGYRATASGKDVTRRIEVRTKNRAYHVRARTQFVEKSDETRMKDRLLANLHQPLPGSTIPFDVGIGPPKSRGRNTWEVPLKVRIPIAALAMLPRGGQETGAFSVYVVTGTSVGSTSEVQRRTQPFQVPRSDLARAKASHFTYDFTLQVDGKSDRLSIGVVDETAREYGLKRIALPERRAK